MAITQKSDVHTLDDGTVFVKLSTQSTSLRGLISSSNDAIENGVTLSNSTGLKLLVDKRNAAQQQSFEESSRESECNLFDAPKKKPRVLNSRDQVKELRTAPQSLTLTLTVDGEPRTVKVLRPVHPLDSVFVEYEASTMGAVLAYLRTAGFDESKRQRSTGLPKGVHRRKQGFMVSFEKPDGLIGRKFVKGVDDALALKADPDGFAGPSTHESTD